MTSSPAQRRGVRLRALLACVGVLLLAGCGDRDRPDQQTATTSATPPPPSTPSMTEPPASGAVPTLRGLGLAEARAAADEAGLRVRVERTTWACLPRGRVLSQRPRPGTEVSLDGQVVVVTNAGDPDRCGLDLPPADADLQRVGRRFLAFARGDGPPPADTSVELFVGGVLARSIPSVDQRDRSSWEGCPGGEGDAYAGWVCPISAVDPFRSYPGPIALTSEPPTHPCARPSTLPDRLDVYRSVTLTPDESRDCLSYVGVQLLVNDVGQVVAVDVVLSEP